ncbi:MAG: hypothetical protein PHX14_14230, partial [Syntrophomonadaceae bacterium]|nr:hypothetical protein [Syntrophomonadaceae bacterium]
TDSSWPLRLVGPAVSGATSISNIASIELKSSASGAPLYTLTPVTDANYQIDYTEGVSMTVNSGISGFKYFAVNVAPVNPHTGPEVVVFTHMRDNTQLSLNVTKADFDQVSTAQAGFNVQSGDIINVYIADDLTNELDRNPIIFQ